MLACSLNDPSFIVPQRLRLSHYNIYYSIKILLLILYYSLLIGINYRGMRCIGAHRARQ